MSAVDKINIELIGLGKALYNNVLAVPFYQRSYAWEDKHVLDLFSDIQTAIHNNENEYFLGTIVTTKCNTLMPEVVDGQQRLATVTILLSAIRDYFANNNTPDNLIRVAGITSKYLYSQDMVTLEKYSKLKLNDADNEFFAKRILEEPTSIHRAIPPLKESHKRISNTATLAKKFVSDIGILFDATTQLASLVEFIHHSLKVIWVSVPDEANAFTIFETLNDRGLALAISDLLKNYLFGISGTRVTEVQSRWVEMISILEATDNEDIVVTYIRHLWSSKYGSTREKDLYNEIKKHVRNKQQAVDFSTELAESAKLYSAILNPSHTFWGKYSPTAREHMNTLNLLKMIQIRPLLLAVLSKFTVHETEITLRRMVSWVVRFLIVGGLGGGTLETQYSLKAKDIFNDLITTADKLSAELIKIIPSDARFRDEFGNASVSTHYLARYYLRVLEKHIKGVANPEFIPIDNSDIVNLEHILPQNASSSWNIFSDEDKALYNRRIGNLSLLQNTINTSAGNDSFTYKKHFYSQSSYHFTKELNNYSDWTKESIIERQLRLAKLAVKSWPLK